MFYRISATFSLMGTCWRVLRKDKEILFFPLLSSIICLSILFAFGYHFSAENRISELRNNEVLSIVVGISLLYSITFIVALFNVGVIACANIRLQGGNPGVGDGFKAMFSSLLSVMGWVIIVTTVGVVLNLIAKRSKNLGRFIADLLGTAWEIASFFVLPLIVIEKISPLSALKDSSSKIKDTWGEHLTSNFSFGIIFFVCAIPGIVVLYFGIAKINYIVIGIAIAFFILLALVNSTLETIFRVVLYYYVYHNFVHDEFNEKALEECYASKNGPNDPGTGLPRTSPGFTR
ncbi:DUF6159 family protein [Candidatus Uabimicrobium sp. HlEnr_7]|uniref:DUF6159 family protein n=1 Tax=Candidatus Uabimicrobium helgolandensis TaxID=3095367 RepID=UPI003557025F